jgi:hypothetical protein
VPKVKRMSAGAAGARSWGRMVAAQPRRASERPTAKSRPARAFAPPKTGTEIEFGPVEYLREGAERTLRAPDIRINCRFISGWEASLEGKVAHGLTAGGARLVGSDVLLKGVLRECSLQKKPDPSIATEFGVLLSGINDQHGTGAVLNGIVWQRWDWGTVHIDAQIALTREQHADYFLDTIIEGPQDWPVRPVAEIFYESDVSVFRTGSALVGAIWQIQDNVAVDFELLGGRVNGPTAGEIRAGVTFAPGLCLVNAMIIGRLR